MSDRSAAQLTAAEIVRDAVSASGGIGEPWSSGSDELDAVRVGDRLVVVEADGEILGWLMTMYAVDAGVAVPVEVIADEANGHPVRKLASLLRKIGRPMVWQRVNTGLYRSGRYLVGLLDTGEWFAEGPGVDQCFDHKMQAQAACDAANSGSLSQRS